MINGMNFDKTGAFLVAAFLAVSTASAETKIGLIGLDTGHVAKAARAGEYGPIAGATIVSPDPPEETLEVMAFMEAAQLSARRGGAPITLDEARRLALAGK